MPRPLQPIAHRIILLLGCLGLLSACQTTPEEYLSWHRFPEGSWAAGDTVSFDFFVPRAHRPHQVEVLLRHNDRYLFTQLTLAYSIVHPLGEVVSDSTIILLAQQPGKWLGGGVAFHQVSHTLTPTVNLPYSGLYTIKLVPITRRKALHGIVNVGVSISPQ